MLHSIAAYRPPRLHRYVHAPCSSRFTANRCLHFAIMPRCNEEFILSSVASEGRGK
jgi:hypothetical protein